MTASSVLKEIILIPHHDTSPLFFHPICWWNIRRCVPEHLITCCSVCSVKNDFIKQLSSKLLNFQWHVFGFPPFFHFPFSSFLPYSLSAVLPQNLFFPSHVPPVLSLTLPPEITPKHLTIILFTSPFRIVFLTLFYSFSILILPQLFLSYFNLGWLSPMSWCQSIWPFAPLRSLQE